MNSTLILFLPFSIIVFVVRYDSARTKSVNKLVRITRYRVVSRTSQFHYQSDTPVVASKQLTGFRKIRACPI